MKQASQASDRQAAPSHNNLVAEPGPCGDEIIIVIRNGIVVKFEQRKICLDESV
ncbi:MAG: hypothetical protein E6X17_17765 [Sporomusaceae bacterium]|nr:hypothetical protein [Sporomusaceae bacterium]